MKLAANDICIEHLTLRGERHDSRPVIRAMQSIEAKDVGQRWYIIRQIQFSSPAQQAAQKLGSNINQLIRQAVHGRHASALQANAIFFNSLDELLTQLSLGLSQNQQHHWYWQQWLASKQSTASEQLTQLWCEYSAYLPQLCQQLAEASKLTGIWHLFSADQAQRIITAFCYDKGLNATQFITNKTNYVDTTTSTPTRRDEHLLDSPSPTAQIDLQQLIEKLPHQLLDSWINIAAEYAKKNQQIELAHLSLALLLSASSWQPSLMEKFQTQWSSAVISWQRCLVSQGNPIQHHQAKKQTESQQQQTNSAIKPAVLNSSQTQHKKTDHTAETQTHKKQQNVVHDSEPTAFNEQTLQHSPDEFICEYGGVFYLINLIQRYLQKHTHRQSVLEQPDAGWALLWQLAQLIAGEDQQQLLLDQGLAHCLEQAIGEQAAQNIDQSALEQLPQDIANTIYNDEKMRSLCTTTLLHKKAHIQLTRSHLDVYFSSQSIELEIRLAGLDINPGWVPWLGRVVNFHYRDESPAYE